MEKFEKVTKAVDELQHKMDERKDYILNICGTVGGARNVTVGGDLNNLIAAITVAIETLSAENPDTMDAPVHYSFGELIGLIVDHHTADAITRTMFLTSDEDDDDSSTPLKN